MDGWRRAWVGARRETGFAFHAQGFGPGEFAWKVPAGGRFVVDADDGSAKRQITAASDAEGRLVFTLPMDGMHGVDIAVRRLADPQ